MTNKQWLNRQGLHMVKNDVEIFWTEWNPAEEEEYTVDPLGLQNYAEILADQILPGITSRTRKPRYYSFICWCLQLIEENEAKLGISEFNRVLDVDTKLMALEKLLVLSIVAYYNSIGKDVPDEEKPLLGIDKASAYFQHGKKLFSLGKDYNFLKNQRFLGCFGAYKTSLEKLGFMDLATYAATKFDELSGEQLARVFCNRNEIKRIAIKALVKGEIRLEELVKLGKHFSLTSTAMNAHEKNIISSRLKEKYSARAETFELFENALGETDIETIENVFGGSPKGHEEILKKLEIIKVYEYFSLAVSAIFESMLLILQQGKRLSDLYLSGTKLGTNAKGLFRELLKFNPNELDLSVQLLSHIADELQKKLIPYMLSNDNEYMRSLSSFITEVCRIMSSSASSSEKVAELLKVIVERHRKLKGSWTWIAENPMTHELNLNKSSWKVPKHHSYRIDSLKQLTDELR